MDKKIIYLHGKGGNAQEAAQFQSLFSDCEVIGFDYAAQTPWEAKEEFPHFFDTVCRKGEKVELIANSIGAFFAMCAWGEQPIEKAYFISPIVDMRRLIADMMSWAKVTEQELFLQKEIHTDFGETLSWEYLCYVKEHPIVWNVPTHILYGEGDNLTAYPTMAKFAKEHSATLTVMKNGEHWFHTKEQMEFLANWLRLVSG